MSAKQLLKKFGAENDQCCEAILEWFIENNRRVNGAELSLKQFRYFKPRQRIWVHFSPETVARKARLLRSWGLLNDGKDTLGHVWYELASQANVEASSRFEFVPVLDEFGRAVAMRQVLVT